jgi:hypothetical protein
MFETALSREGNCKGVKSGFAPRSEAEQTFKATYMKGWGLYDNAMADIKKHPERRDAILKGALDDVHLKMMAAFARAERMLVSMGFTHEQANKIVSAEAEGVLAGNISNKIEHDAEEFKSSYLGERCMFYDVAMARAHNHPEQREAILQDALDKTLHLMMPAALVEEKMLLKSIGFTEKQANDRRLVDVRERLSKLPDTEGKSTSSVQLRAEW